MQHWVLICKLWDKMSILDWEGGVGECELLVVIYAFHYSFLEHSEFLGYMFAYVVLLAGRYRGPVLILLGLKPLRSRMVKCASGRRF